MTVENVIGKGDAYVYVTEPAANYGDAITLRIGSGTNNSFIHFTLPFKKGTTIVSAKLALWLKQGWDTGGPHTITARRIVEPWKESKVTWNNAPAIDSVTATKNVVNSPDDTKIIFDLTALVQGIADGEIYHGFRLSVDTSPAKTLYSSDDIVHPEFHPAMVVTWIPPPSKPTSLLPAASLAVSKSKPFLSWLYATTEGDFQTEFNVQVSTVSNFASVEFDSGWVVSPLTSLDLSLTAYGGVPDAATRYWRVRSKNTMGAISQWSEVATFTRFTKGVLTIVTPTGSQINTSPTVTHTFTGRTQESVQYIVELLDPAGDTIVHDTGQFGSTVFGYTLPAGVITQPGTTYRLTLRVWDTIDRQDTSGDSAYVESTSTFTYASSGAPAVIGSLSLAGSTSLPYADLLWTRSTRPDYFAVKIDGSYIETRIVPNTVETTPGGDSYLLRIWHLAPRVPHIAEVEAVVISGGVAQNSSGNPTISFTLVPMNKWLVATDYPDLKVVLISQSPPDVAIGESGTTFFPIARKDPVRILDSIRGYEGSASGGIADYMGVTKETYKANLEKIKGLGPGACIRLVWADMNIQIGLGELVLRPSIENWLDVSFQFWQVGDFSPNLAGP